MPLTPREDRCDVGVVDVTHAVVIGLAVRRFRIRQSQLVQLVKLLQPLRFGRR